MEHWNGQSLFLCLVLVSSDKFDLIHLLPLIFYSTVLIILFFYYNQEAEEYLVMNALCKIFDIMFKARTIQESKRDKEQFLY